MIQVSKILWVQLRWLKCASCLAEFPKATFAGETDMATGGWRTTTDLVSKTVYIYDLCETGEIVAKGKHAAVLKSERLSLKPGESFQEYFKRGQAMKLRTFYQCISCENGVAEEIREITEKQLQLRGYSLVRLK